MLLNLLVAQAYRLLPVCLFVLLACGVAAHGGQPDAGGPVSELLEAARNLRLSDERLWRILLHYPDGASRSLIDDPAFFLSPEGKHSPSAELAATIEAMFAPAPLGDTHLLCRYPARAEWLRQRLSLDRSRLPKPVCGELDKYLETINPRSATLMFPAAYMNSPASMFGHTYLRIDGEYRSELLGYAVNYSAQTDESNGMVYAWKGIFGLYKGYFSILPHYAKIREYSSMEHRDIWEYRLNLNEDEVRRMTLHVWELREHYSDYFFFDENCSYNLLFLLVSARPGVTLTTRATPLVIPVNTVTEIKNAGLVSSTGFRASQGERIRSLVRKLDNDAIDLARVLSRPPGRAQIPLLATLPAEQRTSALELAIELLQHDYDKQRITQDEYRTHLLDLLRQRTLLPPRTGRNIPRNRPDEPERGHPSARLAVGYGSDSGHAFVETGVRPAYHALDDPGEGYPDGAQIQFMNAAMRYYPGREKVRLQRLDLVDIVSLAPYDRIFRRISWKAATGVVRILNRAGSDTPVWQFSSGGGVTTDLGERGRFFVMSDLGAYLGGGLRNHNAVGAGVSAGLLLRPAAGIIFQSRARHSWFPWAEFSDMKQVESSLTHALTRSNSLEARHVYRGSAGHDRHEFTLLWNHYF